MPNLTEAADVPASHSPRPDSHNAAVDDAVADRGLCGMTHLNTGHTCLLPERHAGGCDFREAPEQNK